MFLGAAGGTDPEPVAIAANECDQVAAVGEPRVGRLERLARPRRIPAQSEDVRDALTLHPVQDPAGRIARVGASQVSHGLDVILPLDPGDELQRLLPGSQPIGH